MRVDNANWQSFFLGSFVGTRVSETVLCPQGSVCEYDDGVDWSTFPVPSTTVSGYAPSKHNFKAPLLAYVRVMSLGSHHYCLCEVYGRGIGPLLNRLDTLRLVATPKSPFDCLDLCDQIPRGGHKDEPWEAPLCPLFKSTTPNKLVVRNQGVDMGYYCCTESWNAEKLKEAVSVLPANQDALTCNGSIENVPYLIRAPSETIILRDPLEVWHPQDWAAYLAPTSGPLDVGFLTEILDDYTTEGTQATLVGLECVEFWIPPRLLGRVSDERASSPAIMSPQWTHTVPMDFIRRGCREGEELATPNTFAVKTFSEHYAQEYHKRRFEIDDDMDPVLQVASLESQLLKLDV